MYIINIRLIQDFRDIKVYLTISLLREWGQQSAHGSYAMTRNPSPKARISMLGDVLKLLRHRRRSVRTVTIHPDGTIDVKLGEPWEMTEDERFADEIARWHRNNPD